MKIWYEKINIYYKVLMRGGSKYELGNRHVWFSSISCSVMYKRDFAVLVLSAFAVYFALQNDGNFSFKKAW